MKKILISPAHYLLDINSQSEFYLSSKIIYSLAKKNKKIEYHVLCGYCANKDIIPKNVIVYELFNDYNFSLSLKNRLIFYFWIFIKSIEVSLKNKFSKIWHMLPNGRYSYNLFILLKLYKLLGIKKCIIGPLQIFHKSKDYLKVNNGKLLVTKEKNNIIFFIFRVLSVFSKNYFNNFNKYIFISKSSMKDYQIFNINKINSKIIGIGIDQNKFLFTKKEIKYPINFLYVGNFTQNKNIDKILYILKEYKKLKKEFILNLVGDGEEMDNIKILVKNLSLNKQVIFHGFVHNSEVYQFYKNAHYLFLLSKNEGFPHTLLESWSSGVVFIGSDILAFKNIVKNSYNGLIYNMEYPINYAKIAKDIYSIDEKKYNLIIDNARSDCQEYYWENIIDKYYEEVIS